MSLEVATWLVHALYAYAAIGVALLPWWHARGLRRLDAATVNSPWGFRVMISPGLVAFWPWLWSKAWKSDGHPRPEKNAHRVQAGLANADLRGDAAATVHLT